jgi:hypothetical protein
MAAIADLKVRFAVVRLNVCREGCLGTRLPGSRRLTTRTPPGRTIYLATVDKDTRRLRMASTRQVSSPMAARGASSRSAVTSGAVQLPPRSRHWLAALA